MSDDPRISVAAVTRNRPDSLRRTLASLRAQGDQPWEVVVSDDSDAPADAATGDVCRAFGARYVRGPRRGLYANRNAVAVACGGTHVRTMDDDHEFPDGHLRACHAAVRSDPTSVWIVGEYSPPELDPTRDPPPPAQLHPRGFSVRPADPQRCWSIADGASIYPRDIFDRGLRYSEAFKFGAAYLEFGSRLHWLGQRIRFLPGTYVLHHFDPAARSFMDAQVDLSSRVFAMLCHSMLYQPTAMNRLLTAAELVKQAFLSPTRAARAVRSGHRAYLARRAEPTVGPVR